MEKQVNLLIIDGQGGGMGGRLAESLKNRLPNLFITAVGTNAIATQTMLKSGADRGATGENAAVVACRTADIIVGPVGIAVADSLYGEITPKMAVTVGQSAAKKVLLPMNMCDILIPGTAKLSTTRLIEECVEKISEMI